VRGGETVQFGSWVTRHGPLLVAEGHDRMALRWVARNRAYFNHFWTSTAPALAVHGRWRYRSRQNVDVDTDGNIGYHAAGCDPPQFFRDVVDLRANSSGMVTFRLNNSLPSIIRLRLIVTANQSFPADYPYRVNGNFRPITARARSVIG
jgi:acyl-homoserine lactone acylase PvdQ